MCPITLLFGLYSDSMYGLDLSSRKSSVLEATHHGLVFWVHVLSFALLHAREQKKGVLVEHEEEMVFSFYRNFCFFLVLHETHT
jgi:hypothetical protein